MSCALAIAHPALVGHHQVQVVVSKGLGPRFLPRLIRCSRQAEKAYPLRDRMSLSTSRSILSIVAS